MSQLNYNHLRYFRAIALEGSLTRAARHLNITQSALSVQLRSLEESLGQPLFERRNRTLSLTEAGHIALEYAEGIFRSGEELADVLRHQSRRSRRLLRVGATSTLSRNFQISLLGPLIGDDTVEVIITSGSLRELLGQLDGHLLDIVLCNTEVRRESGEKWHCHLLSEQPVSLVGHPSRSRKAFRFPQDLEQTPLVLPTRESSIRVAFDTLIERHGIRVNVAAEADDMAMLRLMARETKGLTLVPPVVVTDELKAGLLVERHRLPQIQERFYAITQSRRFPNPLLRRLISSKL